MSEFSTGPKVSPRSRRRPTSHRLLLGISGLVLMGTIAAACGGSGGSGSSTTTTKAPGARGTQATTTAVDTKANSKLGTILVDGKGFTLYRLSTDSTNKSTCDAACAQIWPPLLVTGGGSPVAGSGVSGLGMIKVAAGEQVTYHGMPLYTYAGDTAPGQTNGQDLKDSWGTWFTIVTKPLPGGTTTTTGGGGGIGF